MLGQTPLHLATDEPACLKLLVQAASSAVLNHLDLCGESALDHARTSSRWRCKDSGRWCSRCNCADPILFLLIADCAITFGKDGALADFEQLPDRCRNRYLRHLQNRRDRLKLLALENLGVLEQKRLRLRHDSLLDFHAAEAVRLLQEQGVEVPGALIVDGRSVYHRITFGVDFSHLDSFYNIGFRDLDPFRADIWSGNEILTMQLHLSSPEYSFWLFQHGFDVLRFLTPSSLAPNDCPKQGVFTGHLVFFHMGEYISQDQHIWSRNTEAMNLLHKEILASELLDNCRCECSPRGCSPLTWMLKGALDSSRSDFGRVHRKRLLAWVPSFYPTWTFAHHLEMLRFMTFDALGIMHTCCNPKLLPRYGHSKDDAAEIEAEEADLLAVFEVLMADLEAELGTRFTSGDAGPSTFVDFWLTVGRFRIIKELETLKANIMSEAERRKAEEIGVIWDPKKKCGRV